MQMFDAEDWMTNDLRISEAIEQFPEVFGLRAFPGKEFAFSHQYSYIDDSNRVMLYSMIHNDKGQWVCFSKGTVEEFKREIV